MLYSHSPDRFVHFHIPKTAGTTFRAQCSSVLKLFGVDKVVENAGYYLDLATAAEKMLPDIFAAEKAILSGHYRYREMRPRLRNLPAPVGLTTFVRDPVKRIVSDYVYSSSNVHPGREAFIAQYPTFESYIECDGQTNKQVNYFSCSPEESLEETLETLYSQFYFIGVSERYEADMVKFLKTLGQTFTEAAQKNTSPDKQHSLELIARHSAQIEHYAARDVEFYRAIVQRTPLPMNTIGSENNG